MKLIMRIFFILGIVIFVQIGYWALTPTTAPSWTGFGPYQGQENFTREKTLWDWLDLLVIPAFLAIGASILSAIQKQSEKMIEKDRQRQSNLNAYFEKISNLLVEQKLRTSKTGSESRILARTYSLFAFRNLDGKRKAEALQFLHEAGLISTNPIVNLNGANLSESELSNAPLIGAEIKGALFNDANFEGANLTKTNLLGCSLINTNFEKATFENANLSYSDLTNANLIGVDLTSANMDWVILDNANLTNAKITAQQIKNIYSSKNTKFPKQI